MADELRPTDFVSEEDLKAEVVHLQQEREASLNVAKWMQKRALELEEKDDEKSRHFAKQYRAGGANARARARQVTSGRIGYRPTTRRTFVGDLIDETGDLSMAQKLAGHAFVGTTVRYDRLSKRAKKATASHLRVPYRGSVGNLRQGTPSRAIELADPGCGTKVLEGLRPGQAPPAREPREGESVGGSAW